MASRISVLALAAGLGLAGGAVLLETLPTASLGPSGRDRPAMAPALGPPPFTKSACFADVPADTAPREDGDLPQPPESADPEPEGAEPSAWVQPVLSGVVLDSEGNPLSGATLVGPPRYRHCYSIAPLRQPVGEGGLFSWEPKWLRSPDKTEFTVTARGFASREFSLSAAQVEQARSDGAFAGIEIRLRREAVLEGVVLGPDGTPKEGASVVLTHDIVSKVSEGYREERTDAQGRFRFESLGTNAAWVSAGDFPLLSSDIDYAGLCLREGETTTVELMLLESTEMELAVRVVGVGPGWTLRIGNAGYACDSALLTVPARTGRVWFEFVDAEGAYRAGGWRDIPRGVTEHAWDFDFSDQRPREEPRPGSDPGDPPPPDDGVGTPTPPDPGEETPTPPEIGE